MQKQAGCKNRQDAKTGRMQKQAGCLFHGYQIKKV
jgi:hypothetical protein